LRLVPEVLQRSVPQVFLAAQVLATRPGFTHCVTGRFMPLGAFPGCSWARFQSRSRSSLFNEIKADPT
jgi:hypothetical protein